MNHPISIMAISCDNFKLEIGGLTLLDKTKLIIAPGLKYGLVGRNGTGKSTLLRYINDKYNDSHNIYYVEQEIESSNDSILMTVLSSNKKLYDLLEKEKELENSESEYNEVEWNSLQEQLELIHPGKEKSIIHRILYGLGFNNKEHELPVSSFSGGWRMRVSLAKALYHKPMFLLLDEPTNHLDLNAVIWLKSYLQDEFKNALLVVSHDVSFLNTIVNNIVFLNSNNKTLEYFRGNYKKFDKMRLINERKQDKDWNNYQKKLSKSKTKINSKTSKTSKKLVKIERPEKKYEPKILLKKVDFPRNHTLDLLQLKNASVKYGFGDYILKNVDFTVKMNSRIVVVGKNGSGKSTFLKALTGKLPISSTNSDLAVQIKSDIIRIGYFHQHFEEMFNYDQTPIKYLKDKYSKNNEDIRRQLGIIGIPGKQHKVTIEQLSGGQKARLAFVDIIMNEPHLIILDEPTNHLDIETIDSLIKSINSFNGSIIMVTHNTDLICGTNCEIYVAEEESSNIIKFNGDFDDYVTMVLKDVLLNVK